MKDYENLLPLTKSLGESLSNADYEHPEELRITLIEAQEYRIKTLLHNGMGSSTLFKTSDASVTKKPYTCLITWGDLLFNEDPLSATRFMYDLDETVLESMPVQLLIDNHDFLMFSIDHEVFHCIDAFTNGPMFLRTTDPTKSCCNRARSELRADTYAAMAHLSRHPDKKDFLLNIGNARTLNLLNWDVQHYTSERLYEISKIPGITVTQDIKTLVRQSLELANKLAPTYTDHRQFLVNLWAALRELGVDESVVPSDLEILAEEQPQEDKVKVICDKINKAHSAVHTSR